MDNEAELLAGFLAVIEVGPDLAVTRVRGRTHEVFGTGAEEAVGRGLAELLPIAGGEAAWRAGLAREEDGPRTWEIVGPAGARVFEAWTQVRRDAAGTPIGFVLYGHDVTARVAAERHVALESAMLSAIKDNLDVAVWAIDREGRFLYQDGQAVRAAGMQPGQLVGMNMLELYTGSAERELVVRALAGEPTHIADAPAHDRFWNSWYIPMPANVSEAAVVGVSLDVTELKRRELELRERLALIEEQQQTIRELSTPIIEVWEGVLTMPIVGLVDSTRAADAMDSLLAAVTATRARFAILDLTGVDVVDTGTASHLMAMIAAVRLLGAEGILTGIRPTVAQTIVGLEVDLAKVAVFAKLRDALQHCLRAGVGLRA